MLAGRSANVDAVVRSAWTDLLPHVCPRGLALLAVGGYGRRELFPYSDVDLLLLAEKEPAGAGKDALSSFLRSLWDSGLRLSHSVRTPKECCELHDQNIELNVSLLDQRFLAGDRALHVRLEERLPEFLRARRESLIGRLCGLTHQRHARYQNTIYHLEPNVKETPGGLRDLHLLWWLNKLRDDAAAGGDWLEALEASRAFLARLRCFLHFRAGRDDNSLSFDAQEEFSNQFYLPGGPPETWMRHYFFHARAVHRAAVRAMDWNEGRHSGLLKDFRRWRSRLSNAEFSVLRDRVFFKSPQSIPYDPELVMRLFQFLARHGFRLSLEAERRIAEQMPVIERHYAQVAPHWAALAETLSLERASVGLRAMHETGVLRAVFPEWRRIECLVVRDFYHRYTVDEHTLLAVESLEELARTPAPERRRFAELLAEVDQPMVLRLAILFHDIGKGEADGSHAIRSADLADQAMARIQLPVRERHLVRFLIERHLDLSAAMSGRDLVDPATIRALAGNIGTVERLKNLTLITYADISAVHPAALSPWRVEQLWLLYMAVYNELTRELDTDRIQRAAAPSPEKADFLEGFPSRYLRTHTEEEIDRHLELEREAREAGVAVRVESRNGVYELTIVTRDRPFLLTSVAGTLSSFGLNILKAEAFANARGTILDTFAFEDPKRNLDLNPPEVERLKMTLEKVARGRLRARDLLKGRPAPAPPSRGSRIEPRISFNQSASETSTLIETVSEDRPGLLYELTRAISEAGCNIEVVLIDTEAHKAIDVFYVTHAGKKLSPELSQTLRERLLAIWPPRS